jgi:hypothetical protein
MSLDTQRVYAFLYIPPGADEEDALDWINTQLPSSPPSVAESIVTLHLHDEILKGWRENGNIPLEFLRGR